MEVTLVGSLIFEMLLKFHKVDQIRDATSAGSEWVDAGL